MPEFSLVTLNMLVDLSRWDQRSVLMVKQLKKLTPDVIALQEVNLETEPSNAHWLANRLNKKLSEDQPKYEVYLSPKCGLSKKGECLAVLSRLPIKRQENLDLLSQNRMAELIELRVDGEAVMLVNGHFYLQKGASSARQKQVETLLDWLDTQPVEIPVVVCGDFNATPDMPSIKTMREYFDSAHRQIHGEEPEYTYPTPLESSLKNKFQDALRNALKIGTQSEQKWQGTVDYIFVDPRLQTQECQVVLNKPDKNDPTLYPSDHFGIYALIKVN